MRCPSCNGTNIATNISSMAAERPDGAWHYHARCCDCGQRLWWNARPGDAAPLIKSGDHPDCAFIGPAAQKSATNVITSGR
jgi:hypothetical protein